MKAKKANTTKGVAIDKLVRQILTSQVYGVARRTPLSYAKKMSSKFKADIHMKREDLQPVHSFKLRGAYNKISHLDATQQARGIVTASAGNHAQGVALAAQTLGIKATVVMPETTPLIKVNAVKEYGASVVLTGDNYTEAATHATELAKKRNQEFIHPFDDPLVIAGQGTIGLELIEQLGSLEMVFIPVGGGGLIAGIAAYIKTVKPSVRIIGVEPTESPAMFYSRKAGRRVKLDRVGIFADGVAVKEVGKLTFKLVQQYVDDIVLVTNDEICAAIQAIYDDTRSIVEPAGALAIAGISRFAKHHEIAGRQIVAINSGANMNFDRLQYVSERTLTGSGAEALYTVTLLEQAGALDHFCKEVLKEHSISEFNYRMSTRRTAHIFVGVRLNNGNDKQQFEKSMKKHKYHFVDLTNSELAKSHIRHMVGGKSNDTKNEVLYNFTFPERIGALSKFLMAMRNRWNISLFHYRANGGDSGQVLIGLEVPPTEKKLFNEFLAQLNYPWIEETTNPAYKIFL